MKCVTDKGCARCGAVPIVEDGLCADCSELGYDGLEDDDEDDFEDDDDEDDDGPPEGDDF
jgi:hypothetical protein